MGWVSSLLLASLAVAQGDVTVHYEHGTETSVTFSSLADARAHIIASASAEELVRRPPRVEIGQGRYHELLQLDHRALSGVRWEGVPGEDGSLPIISGGVEIPVSRFEPWGESKEIVTASLAGLNVSDLGGMVSGNAVSSKKSIPRPDCDHTPLPQPLPITRTSN